MKRKAACALYAFLVSMICFGILARAVADTGVVLVATEKPSAQIIDDKTYRSCVPLEALHFEGNQAYVYVASEQQGFSGTELVARKTGVTVLRTGPDCAALADGALSSQQDVVARADRLLAEGSKVRAVDA
ncbi:hypothetical protein [Raoultibacter phocaeensis]|uniref:hypothetical protein n=1 Tax=Raoultibacter phocaeensis TaxID=2479841 RepID=UPI0011187B03|nr:hypothetical protein [Raoultibacter phocaeensis]